MAKRGYSKDDVSAMVNALYQYQAGTPPFDKQYGGENFIPRNWWAAMPVSDPGVRTLRDLALALEDATPHAAGCERRFSSMGWLKSSVRNRMGTSTNGALAMIKAFNQHHVPVPKPKK